MKKKIIVAVVLSIILWNNNVWAKSVYSLTEHGTKLYKEGKYDKALEKFIAAQVEEPEDPKVSYNLGNAYYKMQDYENAVKNYMQTAMKSEDPKLEEKAYYNLGNSYFRQGKLNDAVTNYQKALEIDSKDEDAKKNLEFVKKLIEQHKQQQQKQADNSNKEDNKEQKDQEQKGEEKQQQSKEEQQNQKGQKQQAQKEEDKEKKDGKIQPAEKQEDQKEGKPQEQAQSLKKMSEEEAQRWLQMLNENKKKFMRQQIMKQKGQSHPVEKDW